MFQSGTFWLVLVVSVAIFWALPKRLRLGFLTLVSMGYLAWLTPLNAGALLVWSLLFYYLAPLAVRRPKSAAGRAVLQQRVATAGGSGSVIDVDTTVLEASPAPTPREHRWVLWLLIGGILAYLGCFKYLGPYFKFIRPRDTTPGDYVIPLGISYFTFKFIHYALEVARGNIKDRSLARFFCYIFLFPTFTEGPIERFDHFLANQRDHLGRDQAVDAIWRIMWGLVKKCVVAELLLSGTFVYADSGLLLRQLHETSITPFTTWGTAMGVYLYEYFDFSGYTDIAIGASQLFGLGIMENFDWPILAPNIGVFWKRWHMTLTGWCINYIYMPVMGWTRKPNFATYVTFVAIALWHAASPAWLFWGLYHATGLVIYQAWARYKRKKKWTWTDKGRWSIPSMCVGIFATFLFVSAGELLTFGNVRSPHDAGKFIAKLFFMHVRG